MKKGSRVIRVFRGEPIGCPGIVVEEDVVVGGSPYSLVLWDNEAMERPFGSSWIMDECLERYNP